MKYLIMMLIVFSGLTLEAQKKAFRDSRGNEIPDSLLIYISVDFKQASLKNAIDEISAKAKVHINYNETILPKTHTVKLSDKNKPATEVLRRVLIGTGIDFIIMPDRQIVLVESRAESTGSVGKSYTISGYVRDEENGETLIGANVYFENNLTGCSTNSYGFYSITIPEGIYYPRFSFVGYESQKYEVELTADYRLSISLKRELVSSDTVIVIAKEENPAASPTIGTIELMPNQLGSIPILFGEQDLLKTLHLLPGVSTYREGDGGLYVRGGDSDQNLMLLDEAPIYNAFHFFGFFSVFNPEAISNVKLIKGPAPAKYGGRLSSVIDINMKEGNQKKFEGVAGLGLIYSRLTLQGPFLQDKGSFVISGRRTYLDLFKYLSGDQDLINSSLYFYDMNLKANYTFSESDRLYLSGYFGNDAMGFTKVFQMNWGNKTGTLRWNHLFSDKLFSNTSLVLSNFTHNILVDPDDNNDDEVSLVSKVQDITAKTDFHYYLDMNNTLKFGASYIRHNFLPADISIKGSTNIDIEVGKRHANEYSLYLSDEIGLWEKFKLDVGLRYTLFAVKGDKDVYDIDDFDGNMDLDFHEKEDKNYSALEPRFIANYMINEISSLKLAFSRNYQYLHMVSNSNAGLPWDIWQPVSSNVKPMLCDQFSVGYFQRINETDSELSVEFFYKKMKNLIDFKDGTNLAYRNYFESEYVFGDGRAYGLELFIKKRLGMVTGWLGYTFSRSERRFDKINTGSWFPARFDKTHDVSLVLMYQINEKWNISGNWVYATGNAITIPHGRYELNGNTYDAYSDRNSYRLPAFHRMDLSVSYTNDLGGTWTFALYNVYGQKNTYTILFRDKKGIDGAKEALRLSLFSIVPSITYTLRF